MITLILLVLAAKISAADPTFAGKAEMNGIKFSEYAGFEEKWKFVTVRYRMDNSEQRFVYGNPLAMKSLEAGSVDYPDGAVFAKIGFMTEEDPSFKSSRVPSGSLRYQFMVRDRVKYAATGGWGYALFDANKVTLEANPEYQAQACYACHLLVPERGQVFSVPLKVSPFAAKNISLPKSDYAMPNSVKFKDVPLAGAPELVRKSLPSVKEIRSVQGEITAHVFRGTIDEIRPSLIEEVLRTGKPAALIGNDKKQFSAVYKDSGRKNCAGGKPLKAVFSTSVPSNAPGAEPYEVVAWQDLCL